MFNSIHVLKHTHVQYVCWVYVFCLSLSDMHAPADYKLGCYDPPNKSQSHAEQWSSVLIRPPFALRMILMKLSQPD